MRTVAVVNAVEGRWAGRAAGEGLRGCRRAAFSVSDMSWQRKTARVKAAQHTLMSYLSSFCLRTVPFTVYDPTLASTCPINVEKVLSGRQGRHRAPDKPGSRRLRGTSRDLSPRRRRRQRSAALRVSCLGTWPGGPGPVARSRRAAASAECYGTAGELLCSDCEERETVAVVDSPWWPAAVVRRTWKFH